MNHPCRLNLIAFLTVLSTLLTLSSPTALADDEQVEPGSQPAPPSHLQAKDRKNDAGNVLLISWDLSPDDRIDLEEPLVIGYRLYRAEVGEDGQPGEFRRIFNEERITPQMREARDEKDVRPGVPYMYKLYAVGPEPDKAISEPAMLDEPAIAIRYWFDMRRGWFLVLTLITCGWIVLFIHLARSGVQLKIRKIGGIEAVDEAVGRATEMGRSILFIPGIADMNEIQTVAGITILSRVARLCAEYDASIEVPTRRSLVMTTARETLEAAYMAGGRPDAYREEMSYYVTDEQFGYVAYLTGYIVREKPAAIFYLGAFFAESLILAETGNSEGAIQIAGTAQPAQLPFFVAACDYTLIGEEFFAASAYLSGEPEQLGTLKGQDIGKIVAGILITIGCLMATAAAVTDSPNVHAAVNYLKMNMLGSEDVPEELTDPEAIEEILDLDDDSDGHGDGDADETAFNLPKPGHFRAVVVNAVTSQSQGEDRPWRPDHSGGSSS